MSGETPDRVVTFKKRPRYPAAEAKEIYRYDQPPPCKHPHTTIDGKSHTLQCDNCKAYLDAFSMLLYWARKWDRLVFEDRRFERANQLLAWLIDRKGRVHLTPSGISARMPGGDGAEIMAGASWSGGLDGLIHAIESLAEKAKEATPKEPPAASGGA